MTELDIQLITVLEVLYGPGFKHEVALPAIKAAVAQYVVGENETANPHDGHLQLAQSGANALRATQRRLLEAGE